MLVPIRILLGLGGIPDHRSSASRWLRRHGVAISKQRGNGGVCEVVNLTDLPDAERLAYIEMECERESLAPGTYDDALHAAYAVAPAPTRAKAERKAAIARFMLTATFGCSQSERVKLVRDQFGPKGTSEPSLSRILKALDGVDPINFAPALLSKQTGRTTLAPMSEGAWEAFLASVQKAAHTHALTAIYDDIELLADAKNWEWPSYRTVMRRWHDLSEMERLTLRHGGERAVRELYQPHRRDAGNVDALQVVEMDGRTLDLWATFEDGTVARPTMLALVDRASFKGLHHVIGTAETALLTRDLILQTCDKYGIFDRLVTDNSRAFASNQIAGGVEHKFRNKGTRRPEWEPPGVCEHLGITLKFTQPHNPGAKIPESKFAKWSRSIDTRPEFAGAHSGHNPMDKPDADTVPVPIELVREIYAREMARDNAKPGRRTQNARRGESYEATFERLLEGRIHRPMTAMQRWRASLVYAVRIVDPRGQIKANGWVYGRDSVDGSQEHLLPYAGRPVLIGTDPADYAAHAVAFDLDTRREIVAGIQPDLAGDYQDADGARKAGKERKRLRKLTREIEATHTRDMTGFYSDLNAVCDLSRQDDPRPQTVVKPNFTDPLRNRTRAKNDADAKRRAEADEVWERVTRVPRKAKGQRSDPLTLLNAASKTEEKKHG